MQLTRLFKELEKHDPSTTRYTEKFETALVEIQELQSQMDFYAASVEMDPSEIESIEEWSNDSLCVYMRSGTRLYVEGNLTDIFKDIKND